MTDDTVTGWRTRALRIWAWLLANDFARGLAIGALGTLAVALLIKVLA